MENDNNMNSLEITHGDFMQMRLFLEVERFIVDARKDLDDFLFNNVHVAIDDNDKQRVSRGLSAKAEAYMNTLDRLCFCFMNDILDIEKFGRQYESIIKDLPTVFKEIYVPETYKNICGVLDMWNTKTKDGE